MLNIYIIFIIRKGEEKFIKINIMIGKIYLRSLFFRNFKTIKIFLNEIMYFRHCNMTAIYIYL